MDIPAGSPVVVSHHYTAAPDRAFDAFEDARVARHFLFATASGEMIVAEIEPGIGGRYTLTGKQPDMGEVRPVGEYVEVGRPQRLVFTFGVPQFDPRMTTVRIDFHPDDNGCCLTLANDGVPVGYTERNREGWNRILAGLLPAYDGIHGAGGLPPA